MKVELLAGADNAGLQENYLWTKREYSDFVIELDVRWRNKTERALDTGIERWKPKIQLQFGTSNKLRVDMSGSFYTGGDRVYSEVGRAMKAKVFMNAEGKWNTFRIRAKDNTFTCWINSNQASECTDHNFSGAASMGF